jgi:hypothetical protein
MLSIKYYLAKPFRDDVTKEDIKALKSVNKPIAKYLNHRPTVIYLFITFRERKLVRVNSREKIKGIYCYHDKKSAKHQIHGALNDLLQFLKAEIIREYRKAVTNNPNLFANIYTAGR